MLSLWMQAWKKTVTCCKCFHNFFCVFSELFTSFRFVALRFDEKTTVLVSYEVVCQVQIQYCLGVSLGSFIMQAISIRESWMSEVCAQDRPCKPPEHWGRNLLIEPPSDEEFPAEVAENFDEGQPWLDINIIH